MKNCTQFLLTGCSALALLACGDDVTKMTNVTNETTGLEVAASADSLGTCDSSVIGKMMFASSENAVYVCADSGWTSLSKSAADGKNGADGSDGKDGENGLDGASCTVKALASGAGYKIICGGDSVGVILNGKNGSDGIDGKDGAAGNSCSAKTLKDGSGYKIICGGDSVGVILNGANGKDGENGSDGKDGTAGNSCTAKTLEDGSGYKIVCGGDSVGVILNGTNGKDGADGENGTDGKDGTNGTSCTVAALADSSGYKIVCGGDSVGVILNGSDGKDGSSNCSLAYNSAGSATLICEGTSVSFHAVSYDSLVDERDGQVYKTVVIGTQTWMAENLNFDYGDSSKSRCRHDSAIYCEKYGRLYRWSAAMDSAAVFSQNGKGCGYGVTCDAIHPVYGVCPAGWHLPSRTEWRTLYSSVDSLVEDSVGIALKSTSGWRNNTNGTDRFGFGSYPYNEETYPGNTNYVEFWSASEIGSEKVYRFNLSYAWQDLRERNEVSKKSWDAVRCVKD